MTRPYLKQKIQENNIPVVGTHIELSDSLSSEVMGQVGYDFVLISADSSESRHAALRNHIAALHAGNTPTVVRLASGLQSHVTRVLELAPDGVVFPAINTAQEAENAMAQCLYPPEGRRRYNPLRAVGYGLSDALTQFKEDSEMMCRFVQLDSAEAMRNLPEIMENKYIDGFFFSPGELLREDGTPDGIYGPDTAVLLREAAALLRENGRPFGVSVMMAGADVLRFWIELGATILASGVDFRYILGGATENLKAVRNI